jgi:SNF2 family DNA or RNA helicase
MIISQWTSALDLCSDYLRENSVRHVRFQGNMNIRQRNEAVK